MSSQDIAYYAAIVLIAAGSLYAFYNLFVRRAVIADLKRSIAALEDRYELMVNAGEIKDDATAIMILRKRSQRAIQHLQNVDLTRVLLAGTRADMSEQYAEETNAIIAAGDEYVRISRRLDQIMIMAFMVNSPLLLSLTMFIAMIVAFFLGLRGLMRIISTRLWSSVDDQSIHRAVHV
jgi:hypothetical protein